MKRHESSAPVEPRPDAESMMGSFSPRSMLDMLFSVAGPSLPTVDLQGIVEGGCEYVQNAAGNAAQVADGLGCLVGHDGSGPPGAGNFQDAESVAELMFHMGAHWRAVETISAAVGWAAQELKRRGKA